MGNRAFDVDAFEQVWHRSLIAHSKEAKCYEKSMGRMRRRILSMTNSLENELHNLSVTCAHGFRTYSSETTEHPKPLESRYIAHLPNTEPKTRSQQSSEAAHGILEQIVHTRLQMFELATKNKHTGNFLKLLDEIEELEARALSVLIIPSDGFLDGDPHIDVTMERLRSQAIDCLQRAIKISQTPESPLNKTEPEKTSVSTCFEALSHLKKPYPTLKMTESFMEATSRYLHPLLSDYNYRKQTMEIKRIVRCACSQVTHLDPLHCLEHVKYLSAFFENKKVNPTATARHCNQERIRLGSLVPLELGTCYGWQCLFSAIQSQAENQFIHSIDSAVAFAYLLCSLLALHPERVPECVARTFLVCPVLATFTDDTASKATEAALLNGNPLQQWRGMARMFAALVLAHPPSSLHCKRPSLLSPSFLWRIIAGICNKDFVPNGTAEVLHGLLEVASETLLHVYGIHARRLFKMIIVRIQRSAYLSSSIPEISLVSTLDAVLTGVTFPTSAGLLTQEFWMPR